ncbi:MAG: hypothetical protein V4596_04170 [Bdellovibrionota bacterium]
MSNAGKKVVTSLLLICFLITDVSPAFGQEFDPTPIALDPSIFTQMDPDKFTQNEKELTEEEKKELKKIIDIPTRNMQEVLFLLKNLYHKVKMNEQTLGAEAVGKIISKRKDSESIQYEFKNVGKAEPLVINTKRGPYYFTKVRHNELKIPILFLDKSQIDIEFLEESEKRVKLGMEYLDPTLQGLSKKELQLELDHRKFILRHFRTLYARMLHSAWNPKFQYQPLSEAFERPKETDTIETPPEEIKSRIDDVLNKPFSELKTKGWFRQLVDRKYDAWVDLAKQETEIAKTREGNEDVMVILYDGSTGEVESKTMIHKPKKFTLDYWKSFWRSKWEPPVYGAPVWDENKGLGKLRVLRTGDYLLGGFFATVLATLALGTGWVFSDALPTGLTAGKVAQVSFAWSLFFGIFGKTWANIAYTGNDFSRFMKAALPGVTQTYSFLGLSSESLALNTGEGFRNTADNAVNIGVKSVTKTSTTEVARERQRTGEAEGTMKVKDFNIVLPWKHNMKFMEFEVVETEIDTLKVFRWIREQFTIQQRDPKAWEQNFILKFHKDIKMTLPWLVPTEHETYIPRQNYENQAVQFITTPVGLLSRFGYMVAGVPLGHLLYLVLGPISEVRQIRYKIKYGQKLAEIGENPTLISRYNEYVQDEIKRWNRLRIFGIPGSQFVGYAVKKVPLEVWDSAKQFSAWLSRKVAYYTFETYQGILKDFKNQEDTRERVRETQDRFALAMTVQTEGGKPHPVQIIQASKKHQRAQHAMCARLFQ